MIRKTISLVFFACAAFFAFVFYVRYFKWRDCFNDQGRCFDPESSSVYLEQAGMVWGLLCAITLIAAIILWRKNSS